jgi:nucleotide-binding universal stress UspA family protein
MHPTHVLVPLDGSPLADDALAHALDVFDCEVTVLNVVTAVDDRMSEGGVLDRADSRRAAARERADELLAAAKRRADEADRTVETALASGEPAATITDYVDDHDVDHVVMGGHGESSGVASRLLGTVATAVVTDAPVTVTVVR